MGTQPPNRLRVVKGHTFANQYVYLDGVSYEDCSFDGCTLIYSVGQASMSCCTMASGTMRQFQGPAAVTLQVLQQMGWRIEYGDGSEPEPVRFPSDAL